MAVDITDIADSTGSLRNTAEGITLIMAFIIFVAAVLDTCIRHRKADAGTSTVRSEGPAQSALMSV
jgi:hypothetical protein